MQSKLLLEKRNKAMFATIILSGVKIESLISLKISESIILNGGGGGI